MKTSHPIVSRSEWIAARKELLKQEKELTRKREALTAERRRLPWMKIDRNYVFDGSGGKETLAGLFDGRGQLIVYHFMMGEDWEEGCRSCSFLMDHMDGPMIHLKARDTNFVAVSSAPIGQIDAFKKRMGWKFKWVSAQGNTFNADFQVSFTQRDMDEGKVVYNFQPIPAGPLPVEEMPGVSCFVKHDQGMFHTYSAYSRGLEPLIGVYNWLDLTAKGRDEEGLAHSMAWLRHHDRYGTDYQVDPSAPYAPPKGSICESSSA